MQQKNEQGRKKANQYRYFTLRHNGTATRAGPCKSDTCNSGDCKSGLRETGKYKTGSCNSIRFPVFPGACLSTGVVQ